MDSKASLRDRFLDKTTALAGSIKDKLGFRKMDSSNSSTRVPFEEVPTIITLQIGQNDWPGVPAHLRTELWLSALHRRDSSGGIGASMIAKFEELSMQEVPLEVAQDIKKDLSRTFPNYICFSTAEWQERLNSILRAYAVYDPEVGYCQGMNFIVGTLMLFLNTAAEAFAALVLLMQERDRRRFFTRSMLLLQVQFWQLGKLMSPTLCQHMESCGVVPMLYAASWLMTGYSADFHISFSARIMDVMLADRCHCPLLKVAVAILQRCEAKLLQMSDLESILTFLKVDVPKWSEAELNDVITDAFGKPWTSRQLSIINNTEGVETVAQGMERVMDLREQLQQLGTGEDEDEDAMDLRTHTAPAAISPRLSGQWSDPIASSMGSADVPTLAPPPSASASFRGSFSPPDSGRLRVTPSVPLPGRTLLSSLATAHSLGRGHSAAATVPLNTAPARRESNLKVGGPRPQVASCLKPSLESQAWAVPTTPSPLLQDFTRQHQAVAVAAALQRHTSSPPGLGTDAAAAADMAAATVAAVAAQATTKRPSPVITCFSRPIVRPGARSCGNGMDEEEWGDFTQAAMDKAGMPLSAWRNRSEARSVPDSPSHLFQQANGAFVRRQPDPNGNFQAAKRWGPSVCAISLPRSTWQHTTHAASVQHIGWQADMGRAGAVQDAARAANTSMVDEPKSPLGSPSRQVLASNLSPFGRSVATARMAAGVAAAASMEVHADEHLEMGSALSPRVSAVDTAVPVLSPVSSSQAAFPVFPEPLRIATDGGNERMRLARLCSAPAAMRASLAGILEAADFTESGFTEFQNAAAAEQLAGYALCPDVEAAAGSDDTEDGFDELAVSGAFSVNLLRSMRRGMDVASADGIATTTLQGGSDPGSMQQPSFGTTGWEVQPQDLSHQSYNSRNGLVDGRSLPGAHSPFSIATPTSPTGPRYFGGHHGWAAQLSSTVPTSPSGAPPFTWRSNSHGGGWAGLCPIAPQSPRATGNLESLGYGARPSCTQAVEDLAAAATLDDDGADLAGDILRAIGALDVSRSMASYDPREKLGEAMFVDTPNKEQQRFFASNQSTPASKDVTGVEDKSTSRGAVSRRISPRVSYSPGDAEQPLYDDPLPGSDMAAQSYIVSAEAGEALCFGETVQYLPMVAEAAAEPCHELVAAGVAEPGHDSAVAAIAAVQCNGLGMAEAVAALQCHGSAMAAAVADQGHGAALTATATEQCDESVAVAAAAAVLVAGQDPSLCPVAVVAAMRAAISSGGDPAESSNTPLVAKMELPHGTSVLQLAHAAAAMEAALDAVCSDEAHVQLAAGSSGEHHLAMLVSRTGSLGKESDLPAVDAEFKFCSGAQSALTCSALSSGSSSCSTTAGGSVAAAEVAQLQVAALKAAAVAAVQGTSLCPVSLAAAKRASCEHASSPHTPLVTKMELPHGTSVLQLAHAAAAVQAALDAADGAQQSYEEGLLLNHSEAQFEPGF